MKRIGTLNGKTIVETSDLNILKDNEVAIRYDGDKLTLLERKDNGEIVEISTGESELSKYINTDIEFINWGLKNDTISIEEFKRVFPKLYNLIEKYKLEHPHTMGYFYDTDVPFIFDIPSNYILKIQRGYYNTNIDEFNFYFDSGCEIDSFDYENNNFTGTARSPLLIKITNNTVKIGFTEI